MNKKIKNFLNIRNILLFFTAVFFLGLASLIVFLQRYQTREVIEYSNLYIIVSSLFILLLVLSLLYVILPIFLRVRRKKISTLNSKFTLYFILIALTPAFFLGIFGTVLINLGVNDWFNEKIKNVINNSVYVAESYLDEHKGTIKGDVYAVSTDLNNSSVTLLEDTSRLVMAIRAQAIIRSLPEVYILNDKGKIIASAFDKNDVFYEPPENAFIRANNGEMAIMSSTTVNKVYALTKLKKFKNLYLFAGRSMDLNVISALNDTISAKNEYTFLENSRNQISILFILIYVIITLFLLLISTLIGIKFAERIVQPLSSVIRATNNISKGSYNNQVVKTNDYIELNALVDSFNKMSSDLVKQRNQIAVTKKHETWSEIARRIAHEIKNPLTPIQLASERLEKQVETKKNPVIEECMQTIRRQVDEIGLLVDEFSSFARLPDPNFNKEDIFLILRNSVEDIKFSHSNINFIINLHKPKFITKIDKSQISRVFQNLLINAIHSIEECSEKNGEVMLSSVENKNSIHISIKDNGAGLKYDLEDLIKPYFTTNKKNGGTGLGLSIVEKILFDHNIEFQLQDRSDKKRGAEVLMTFENNE